MTSDNARANTRLGYCYCNGFGVKKDHEKGLSLLSHAAEKGSAPVAIMLGKYYSSDKAETFDEQKTKYYLCLAADKGSQEAVALLDDLSARTTILDENDSNT